MAAAQHDFPGPSAPTRAGVLADLCLVLAVPLLFFLFAARVELSERVAAWTLRHEFWQADELPLTLVGLPELVPQGPGRDAFG